MISHCTKCCHSTLQQLGSWLNVFRLCGLSGYIQTGWKDEAQTGAESKTWQRTVFVMASSLIPGCQVMSDLLTIREKGVLVTLLEPQSKVSSFHFSIYKICNEVQSLLFLCGAKVKLNWTKTSFDILGVNGTINARKESMLWN